MNLHLTTSIVGNYRSPAQISRVLSERWIADNLYCANCLSSRLSPLPNNNVATDFECEACSEQFEVKSGFRFGRRIVDGAYHSLLRRLAAANNPSLVLLRFDPTKTAVRSLEIVPRQFFVPAIVEQRPPLPPTARRAGWVGCNLRLDLIPTAGRISMILDGEVRLPERVRKAWSQTRFVRTQPNSAERSWIVAVMTIVERFGFAEFGISDVYGHEAALLEIFPHNRNVRAKIRQQLQRLRDAGLLTFVGRGRYQRAR